MNIRLNNIFIFYLGVSHDDDIYLVLENYCMDPRTTDSDKAMLEDMLDFWYSVASDG